MVQTGRQGRLNCWDGLDGKKWLLAACSRDQMRWEVSYEAISTSNRTVQRGSRFAKPRLKGPGPLIDFSSLSQVNFFCGTPISRDAMRCDLDSEAPPLLMDYNA